MEYVCEKFELCPKYAGLQRGVTTCDHYKIHSCSGVCKGEIEINEYNNRVAEALDFINQYENSCLIMEKGRSREEKSFIYLNKGTYAGYGFINNSEDFSHPEDFRNYLIPQKNSSYTDRLVSKYLNTKKNLIKVPLNSMEEVSEIETEQWFG